MKLDCLFPSPTTPAHSQTQGLTGQHLLHSAALLTSSSSSSVLPQLLAHLCRTGEGAGWFYCWGGRARAPWRVGRGLSSAWPTDWLGLASRHHSHVGVAMVTFVSRDDCIREGRGEKEGPKPKRTEWVIRDHKLLGAQVSRDLWLSLTHQAL